MQRYAYERRSEDYHIANKKKGEQEQQKKYECFFLETGQR